ncbi:MAG: 4Fe-4S binding protein [Petrimonas sp.]|nr:4Fe-4S binding protein [Petrimonas sp.]
MVLRTVVAALFFYAVYFGFVHPAKDNLFTGALFWGIFWSLFMVATLPTFGRIFCGICPHGFLGKYITAFGLQKTMPKWMQNRYIGIVLLVVGWWGIYYTFPGVWKTPFATAALFGGMSLVAFAVYYLYKDMGHCKYICPIGTLSRAYDKLSFTKLETYTDYCKDCRTFECASACSHALKPFSFANKNQTDDCTLCMECASSCEAVKFRFTKPAEQLAGTFKTLNAEIWAYILILASIPVSMTFAHGLNRSRIADSMIWNQTAAYFGMSEYAGGFAFAYALLLTVFISVTGLFLASKVLKKDYSSTFSTLGYAYAPLFILGSLGHTLETFFTKDYETIVEGFAQAFGFAADASALASRGDAWLHYFGLFKWIAVVWALVLIYKRLKLIDAARWRKISGYFFASFVVIFFVGINLYQGHVLSTYGVKERGGNTHGSHSHGGDSFQKISFADKTGKRDFSGAEKAAMIKEDEPIHFTLTDPKENAQNGGGRNTHAMSGGSHRPSSEIPSKKAWLVFNGNRPVSNADIETFVFDAGHELKDVKVEQKRGVSTYRFDIPRNGYYNLIAKNCAVKDDTLWYKIAKLEYLHAQHGNDDVYSDDVKKELNIDGIKIDLIRVKDAREKDFFYRHSMGDTLTFKALLDHKPLANANVAIALSSGWTKNVTTDENGIAKFTIVRDYFPAWNEFDKMYKQNLLLTLTYDEEKKGQIDGNEYQKAKYILTYPLSFYPNSSDYESYGYALILLSITLLCAGIVIYLFRRNRTKPFKEVRYEE